MAGTTTTERLADDTEAMGETTSTQSSAPSGRSPATDDRTPSDSLAGCSPRTFRRQRARTFRLSATELLPFRERGPKGGPKGDTGNSPRDWVKWEAFRKWFSRDLGLPSCTAGISRAPAGGYCYHVLNQPITAQTVCRRLSYAERSCNPRPRSQPTHFPHSSSKTTSVPFRLFRLSSGARKGGTK